MKKELAALFTCESWKAIREAIVGEQKAAISQIERGEWDDGDMHTVAAVQRVKNSIRHLAAQHDLEDPFKE
jgi:hypothetical protein